MVASPGKPTGSSGLPLWQKILSVPLTIFVLFGIVGAVWFVGDTVWGWWQSASAPKHYECNLMAEKLIKRKLAFPSSFDEHLMLTADWGKSNANVTGDKERGWVITNNATIFSAKNAFGMSIDYIVVYDGMLDQDGECTGVRLGEFNFYRR